MKIEWKPEAIRAAIDKWDIVPTDENSLESDMRAALDAAIEAQGLDDAFNAGVVSTFEQRAKDLEETYANARAKAIEEAATYLDSIHHNSTAQLIRTLTKEPK